MYTSFARVGRALSALLLVQLLAVSALFAAAPPTDFSDTLVTNLASPTALAFTPDGRLLLTQQTGQLRVYQNGALLATPAINLSAGICSNSERGLLGVAVDPNFTSNHAIYLYYTHNPFVGDPDACPTNDPTNAKIPVNRVSRFTLGDDNLASDETILLDNMLSPNGNHNGGDLHFGQDGYLYVSIGDGGADYAGDSGAGGQNDAARDQFMLLGKIMRITRDGGIPADNPFQGGDSGRCNVNGRTTQAKCQETFAWGLRNPFRFTFKPGTSEFYINDVGQGAQEEIDIGQSAADYGWNCKEGLQTNSTTGKCNPTPANLVDPIFAYGHGTHPAPSPFQNCTAITGGAFVPAGLWPAPYDSAYLFADLGCSKIFRLIPGGGATAVEFATGAGNPSAMIFGPYNDTQALYYAANGAGQIRRIAYTGTIVLDKHRYVPLLRR
jgi:glucose/arabinose dehydrogenase